MGVMWVVKIKCKCHKLFRSSFGSEKYEGDSLGYCIMEFAIYVGHLLLSEKWKQGMETRIMVLKPNEEGDGESI